MKWFKHDSDASSDAKIKKLIIRHGAVGYAVYFHCLELITADLSESKLTFELEHDSEIIADNLKIHGNGMEAGVDIVNKIMNTIIELDLFRESSDRIFCIKLAKRLDTSMTSNPRFRDLIKKSHDRVMIESGLSHDTVMQEENRIDLNRHKENIRVEPEKSVSVQEPKPLSRMRDDLAQYWQEAITAIQPDSTWGNHGKERQQLNTLANKTRNLFQSTVFFTSETEIVVAVLEQFVELREYGRDKRINGCPVLPSKISQFWPEITTALAERSRTVESNDELIF